MRTEETRGNRLLGLAVIATPILWLATELVSPPLKSNAADQLAVIARESGRWYWYTVLMVIGMIVWVPAAFGLARPAATRAPRLAKTGAILLAFNGIIAAGDAITQLVTWQMVTGGADRTQMAALLDRFDNAAGATPIFLPGGLALLVGAVVLAVAIHRSRTAPGWAAAAFAVGIFVDFAGFMSNSPAVIAAGAAMVLPISLIVGRQLVAIRRPMPIPAPVATADA
jgi:hypothetical protein